MAFQLHKFRRHRSKKNGKEKKTEKNTFFHKQNRRNAENYITDVKETHLF